MKSPAKVLLVPAFFIIICCGKHKPEIKDAGNTQSRDTAEDSPSSGGAIVRAAARDHSLPPNIRQSAVVFQRTLDGLEADKKEFARAVRELSTTRNERTCQIWVSMMRASEAGLPGALPQKDEFANLEKRSREGTLEGVESNPLRFIDILRACVTKLTEFDMPEADQEVEAFMKRFEAKYGTTEMGKFFLNYYRTEIGQSLEVRKKGGASWKRQRRVDRNSE